MKLRNLLLIGGMAVMGAAFTSCSKDVAFDSEGLANQAVQKLNDEYDANFAKRYGAIDPNQTWDFASMTPIRRLPSTSAATRAAGDATITLKEKGNLTINQSVIAWMHDKMPAGHNNTAVGNPFCASVTSSRNTFTIVPFYQGKASYTWELWVRIGGTDKLIWTKNQDLKYIDANGVEYGLTNDGVPAAAAEIKAPTFTYEATPDVDMFFYLKVWTEKTGTKYPNGTAVILSSLDDNCMRALEGLQKPEGVSDDDFVTLVGCEDGSDNDFEDLAFMFIGPRMRRVDVVEETAAKRYMMEDLGDTDDFDFNDVVVDVTSVCQKRITWVENNDHVMEKVSEEEIAGSRKQEAIVRAAGGIYNFTLKIGDKEWTKNENLDASSMLNTGWQGATIDYSKELDKFDVTGWVPSENNISLTVTLPNGVKSGDPTVYTIKFPKAGTAPKMIAVEPTRNWMKERTMVPGGTGSDDDWWE